MLVNTHKLIFTLIIFSSSWNIVQAQEAWTLEQCIDTALAHNKNLQVNRNSISLSQERVKETKANLIPKIIANADYKYFIELPYQLMPVSALDPQVPEGKFREIQFGVPHNINANVQLAMPLYNPQINGGIQISKIAVEISELHYKKTEEQVLFDITTLFYNAQIIKHQLDFLANNLINTNKLLKNLQLLHEQLLAKGSDVNKVKLQADQLTTQIEIAGNNYEQVLNALKLNMGIALDTQMEIETDIALQQIDSYTTQTNTEIQLIQIQNKLLNSELKTLKQSSYLPSLNLIASYGTAGFGYDKNPNDFLKFYPVSFAGVQLSYPLFNGTATQRKINQKKWEIKNNELQVQLIEDKTKMEIVNAKRQRKTAILTVTNTENQNRQAQAIYEQTLLQKNHGTANLTDVLLADNELRQSQQNYLSAIVDFLKADLMLKKLTGNLNSINK